MEDPVYRPLFRLFDTALVIYPLLDAVLETAQWNKSYLERRAGEGFTTATELADTLVRASGLPFRTAHKVTAAVVKAAQQAGKTAAQVASADVDAAAQAVLGHPLNLPEETIRQALDPRHFIEIRTIPGGPAPAAMRSLLAKQTSQLQSDLAWLDGQRSPAKNRRSGITDRP